MAAAVFILCRPGGGGWPAEARDDCNRLIRDRCLYQKPKLVRNGDEIRQGGVRFDVSGSLNRRQTGASFAVIAYRQATANFVLVVSR
jgi:hypothetical protein